MSKGARRSDIMDICPEGFEDELKSFIDELESEVSKIVDELSITSISELDKIETARDMADDLADSLW